MEMPQIATYFLGAFTIADYRMENLRNQNCSALIELRQDRFRSGRKQGSESEPS